MWNEYVAIDGEIWLEPKKRSTSRTYQADIFCEGVPCNKCPLGDYCERGSYRTSKEWKRIIEEYEKNLRILKRNIDKYIV